VPLGEPRAEPERPPTRLPGRKGEQRSEMKEKHLRTTSDSGVSGTDGIELAIRATSNSHGIFTQAGEGYPGGAEVVG